MMLTSWIFVNNQLDAHFFFLYLLFQFYTCFKQPSAHHQKSQLYHYNLWFLSHYVGDHVVILKKKPKNQQNIKFFHLASFQTAHVFIQFLKGIGRQRFCDIHCRVFGVECHIEILKIITVGICSLFTQGWGLEAAVTDTCQ